MSEFGSFSGDVVTRWLTHGGDDRNMELLEDFEYIDPTGQQWLAPQGSVVNGASIPSALWAAVGPPFVGDYRRATVLHDVACEEKTEPHPDVHLMFYNAMRLDGVGWLQANAMYQAVKRFGPKWDINSGSSTPTNSPNMRDLKEFLDVVEQAAREIGEDGDVDTVEQRVNEILVGEVKPRPKGKRRVKTEPKLQRSQRPSLNKITASKKPAQNQRKTTQKTIPMLSHAHAAVSTQLADTVELPEFRTAISAELGKEERLRLIDQALVLIEENYVHLPLKEAMHAVDPIQRLKLLRKQVEQTTEEELASVLQFHHDLLAIFLSVRDLHTNYFLPDPIGRKTAFVPFLVEDFFDEDDSDGPRRFLVTRIFDGFDQPPFAPGVEIVRWNGVPIDRAVAINGERFAGSNADANRARGIETLTVRSLIQTLPPDEDFALIEYRTDDGRLHELREPWLVFTPDLGGFASFSEMAQSLAVAQGMDVEQTLVRMAKKILFAPNVVAEEAKMARRKSATKNQGLTSMMPGVLQARTVETSSGDFAYVRIRTFNVDNADSFVNEFIRLIELLPQEGLIIDVRGNGGGLILAGEQLLQVLTPHVIEPTLFQLRNTPLNLRIVEENSFLAPWRKSMRQALATGASFSTGFPITERRRANNIGQRYHGPVVLITDALCYSTTDIFAAGFRDHAIGPIIGIDGNTGAGGANVWTHQLLQQLTTTANSPYQPLPGNAGMRVSMRRTIRVGANAGTVLEDLGVVPDEIHRMTRNDLLQNNIDLIEAAAALIADSPKYRLEIDFGETSDDSQEVVADCFGFNRLDVFVNDRPIGSIDVADGENSFEIPVATGAIVDFRGFDEGSLVAVRKISA